MSGPGLQGIRPCTAAALAVVLISCATPSPPIHEQQWQRARTAHFEIVSSASRTLTLRMARDLERFRATSFEPMGVHAATTAVPTRVYVIGDEATFARIRPNEATAGFMVAGTERNLLIVNAARHSQAVAIAFHEFVHLAEFERGRSRRPTWHREGLAEFLSTARFVRAGVELGRPPPPRVSTLRYGVSLGLRRLMTAPDVASWPSRATDRFYAESWALTHFFLLGHEAGHPDRRGALRDYLAGLDAGIDDETAFAAAFGADFEAIEPEFVRYVSDWDLRRTLIPALPGSTMESVEFEVLSSGEQRRLVAELFDQLGPAYWDRAEAAYASLASEANPGARASLARLAGMRGRPGAVAKLEAAGSAVTAAEDFQAVADGWRAMSEQRNDPDRCERAIPLYRQSLAAAPEGVGALFGLGRCLARTTGGLDEAARVLEQALRLGPAFPPIAITLAQVRAARDEQEAMRSLVADLVLAPHPVPPGNDRLARELSALVRAAGIEPNQGSTRHLTARLEVDEPLADANVRSEVPYAIVQGRAGLSESFLFDVILAIDQSSSTLAASRMDVDGDGLLGVSSRGFGEITASSDPGDSIQAAELVAARRLIGQLSATSTRVGLVGFGSDAEVLVPLGSPEAAIAELARIEREPPGYREQTSLASALLAAGDELFRAREPGRRRARVVILLSDGQATYPTPASARKEAIEVAAALGDHGIRVHAYVLGEEIALNDDTYQRIADLTGGRLVPVTAPAQVVAELEKLRLTGLSAVEIRNLALDDVARAVRVRVDGSFDAVLPLIEGRNEIEVIAVIPERPLLRETRVVSFEAVREPTPEERSETGRMLERLRARGSSIEAQSEILRSRADSEWRRRVEIEIEREEGAEAAPVDVGRGP